jgi:hypothetical protein
LRAWPRARLDKNLLPPKPIDGCILVKPTCQYQCVCARKSKLCEKKQIVREKANCARKSKLCKKKQIVREKANCARKSKLCKTKRNNSSLLNSVCKRNNGLEPNKLAYIYKKLITRDNKLLLQDSNKVFVPGGHHNYTANR